MRRRSFLANSLKGLSAPFFGVPPFCNFLGSHSLPNIKITRIKYYKSPNHRPTFNQSNGIVVIETDEGTMGIGEGGSLDSISQLAGLVIGQNPLQIEDLWQFMYRSYFYPPGREKIHAQGAIDMALWDIKGKLLDVPVYELLGGLSRKHIECYSTGFPGKGPIGETARACIEAGFRAFRFHGSDGINGIYDQKRSLQKTLKICEEIRAGVGPNGDWAIDFHTRLNPSHAVRLCHLIEDLEPFFVEDLIRSENKAAYRSLRQKVRVPIAVGEHHSDKWDIRPLIEEDLIDYSRVTLPNSGGITELKKIAGMCETHYIGLVPHFTGPVSTAALVHVCASSPGEVLMEILGAAPRQEQHLPEYVDFHDGKLWSNDRPGLGVTFDPEQAELLGEFTEFVKPVPTYRRPDGSVTNW